MLCSPKHVASAASALPRVWDKTAYPAISENSWEACLTLTWSILKIWGQIPKVLDFKLSPAAPRQRKDTSSIKLHAKSKKYVMLGIYATQTDSICQKRDVHMCLQPPNRETSSEKCLVTLSTSQSRSFAYVPTMVGVSCIVFWRERDSNCQVEYVGLHQGSLPQFLNLYTYTPGYFLTREIPPAAQDTRKQLEIKRRWLPKRIFKRFRLNFQG